MPDMVFIAGGRFLMGSDRHYPEEAPQHSVEVGSFFIDPTPVTNRQFAEFVAATGYVTVAERPLNPADYPGAAPEMLAPGALVFHRTTGPVNLRDIRNWWRWVPGRAGAPEGPGARSRTARLTRSCKSLMRTQRPTPDGAGRSLPERSRMGMRGTGRAGGRGIRLGRRAFAGRTDHGEHLAGRIPLAKSPRGRARAHLARRRLSRQWLWSPRHGGECLAMDDGLVQPAPPRRCCRPLLRAPDPRTNPRGGAVEASYDPAQPQVRIPRKVVKGGSFLCAANYCRRYRPAARHAQMIDSGMSHIGFRCISHTTHFPTI